jgi:hypothetical protein
VKGSFRGKQFLRDCQEMSMNSLAKFSLWLVLATLFCLAPGASAQGRTNARLASHVGNVTGYSFTSTFMFDPLDKGENNNHKCNPHSNGSNKCAAVPEGGSALMYLLLASLTCCGAMVLRSRRQSAR